MNWSLATWTSGEYFRGVALAIEYGSFELSSDGRPLQLLLGLNVIERADVILEEVTLYHVAERTAVFAALEAMVRHHPDTLITYLEATIGRIGYAGLLDSSRSDVRGFWAWYFRHTKPAPDSWAAMLREALRDRALGSKLSEYIAHQRSGGSLTMAIARVDLAYPSLGWFTHKPASYHLSQLLHQT